MEYYFGIDLGTTNSSISVCVGGAISVVPNADGESVTPSVVHVDELGTVRTGRQAYESWTLDPANTQAEFKRWMGFSDELAFPASGRSISAEELSSEILKSLLDDAQRETGVRPESAVVTVPAAFGQLQCEATTRAAVKAGLQRVPLLQEPIATALAYGADPSAGDQRWLIFDFGGGTLDIAIVSTRNGRLAVLEHRGDNRLGGKDIDRAVAMNIFLPALAANFAVPDSQKLAGAYNALVRRLIRHAEIAKKALSDTEQVTIALNDLGPDREGRTMSTYLTLTRPQMAATIEPLMDRCLKLVRLALEKARMKADELTCVVGVGGPTRMACLQEMLRAQLGVPVRCDLDPMTVVSQGAARYAMIGNCLGGETSAGGRDDKIEKAGGASNSVPILIHHERSSGTESSPVSIAVPLSAGITRVQITANTGRYVWDSGVLPIKNGKLNTTVKLSPKEAVTRFRIRALGAADQELSVDPSGFSIALAAMLAAAPLPHTIAVELTDIHGTRVYEPIFTRDTPLPAVVNRSYRAESALRPSDADGRLPIKFWEVDVSEDPSERWWCGSVEIPAVELSRPIAEGAEIELRIEIDTSRRIRVDAHVPSIRQTFSRNVYLPDPPTAISHLQAQLDASFQRIRSAWERMYQSQREDMRAILQSIQEELDHMALEAHRNMTASARIDPDILLREAASLRTIRLKLAHVEEQLGTGGDPVLLRECRIAAGVTRALAIRNGTAEEQRQCRELESKLASYMSAGDSRGMRWTLQEINSLHAAITAHAPEYWEDWLERLSTTGRFRFISQAEADKWLAKAEGARKRGRTAELQRCIQHLWQLLPDDDSDFRDKEARPGLRGG